MKLVRFDHRKHDVRSFACGVATLDTWLHRYAKRSQKDSLTRVFVLVDQDGEDAKVPILGYFAVSMSSVEVESLSEADRARLPRYPVPAVLMTRLAVSANHQGHGLGGALLYKAAQKALIANDAVAAKLFVVDAIDENAAGFYKGFGFTPSPDDPLRLYIALERLKTRLP
jgi:ribosomal protein S18 acetylase RimI-like enzyme